MLNLNNICGSVFVLMLSLDAQAGVVCKSSHPNFNSEARSFYLKFENLQKAQKLGNCEVRIWIQDVCDEKTHEFLYRASSPI